MSRELTWRERAIRASSRKGWLPEDEALWYDVATCPAAEIARAYGVDPDEALVLASCQAWRELWDLGDNMGRILSGHVKLLPPRFFLKKLDAMEDRALELKRNA